MNPFLEHLSARVDATAADLKTSLHSHVDSTVDSRLDTFESLVRSAVVECIRTEGRYQHWRVETSYTPIGSAHQHNPLNEVPLMSTSFIVGIPPPLLTEFSAAGQVTSECIADVTFPSGHSVSIPLYNVPNQLEFQHISEQSSLLPNLETTEQDNTSAQSAQTNNNQQINLEPFQTDNRVSLLPIASTSAAFSDGLPSTNSVSLVSPSNVSSPSRTVQPPNDIHIKQEQLDDQSDNEDPDTNAHNVTVNIKTELMDCDFVVVKEEIKEEEDHDDDCDGCDRCLVKRELESGDDDAVDNEGTLTNQVTVKTEWDDEEVKEEIKQELKEEYEDDHDDDCDGCERCLVKKEEVSDDDQQGDNEGGLIRGGDNDEVDDERYEVTQPNVDCGQLLSNPSRDSQSASNANESIEEGGTNLSSEQLLHTLNEPNSVTRVTQSAHLLSPSTSTAQTDNPTALNQQATVSTGRNATKRRSSNEPTSNRTEKRSKITLQDDDDGEDGDDTADEGREEAKVIVLYLNCIVANCNVKLDSMDHLHDHLSTVHRLSPLQCYANNCNARFDKRQIGDHIKLSHPQDTRFLCAVCPKEFDSQHKAYKHWYLNHLTGQFECNLASNCAHVTDTRCKMTIHQQVKHYSQLKHFHCTHPGCTASFSRNSLLKQHEMIHLASNPFHCNWPHCSKQCKLRGNLVRHIRTQHFGLPESMKAQKAKNIVDLRDPNEYVRVVVDE